MKLSVYIFVFLFMTLGNSVYGENSSSYGVINLIADLEPPYEIQLVRQESYGSNDEVLIGRIATFAVDELNRVFIADQDLTVIHVFDSDGSYITNFGRQGQGPGEFSTFSFNTTMEIHSNNIYITDTERLFPHRAHIFLVEDFSFLRTMILIGENKNEFDLEGYYPLRIYPRQDGHYLVAYHRLPFEYKDGESYIRYMVQDSSGNIKFGPILEQRDRTNLTYENRDLLIPTTAVHSFPFFSKSLLAYSSKEGLLYTAWSNDFHIRIYTEDGDEIRSFQHSYNNRGLDINRFLEHVVETDYMAQLGEGVVINMIREADNLPDDWPALESMFVDDKNRLWVATIIDDDEVYEWSVLNGDGELLAKFLWPRTLQLAKVKNDYVYALEKDAETDLEEVVRFKYHMN